MKTDICLCGAVMRCQQMSLAIARFGQSESYSLVCIDCGLQGPLAETEDEAIATWHRVQVIRWSDHHAGARL